MYAMRKISLVFIVLAGLGLSSRPSDAQIIFNNFGPGDAYQDQLGWIVFPENDNPIGDGWPEQDMAMAFTPSGADYQLGKIEMALEGDDSNELLIGLMTDVGDLPNPGIGPRFLETWAVADAIPNYDNRHHPPLTVTSVLHPILHAGARYWIVLLPETSNIEANWFWMWNSVGQEDETALAFGTNSGNSWGHSLNEPPVLGAFRVTAGVPESGPLSLLFSSGITCGLVLLRRARRQP